MVEGARPKQPEMIWGKVADDVRGYQEERAKAQQPYQPKHVCLPEWVDVPGNVFAPEVVGAGSAVKHVMPAVSAVMEAGAEVVKATAKGATLRDAGLAQAAYQFGGGQNLRLHLTSNCNMWIKDLAPQGKPLKGLSSPCRVRLRSQPEANELQRC